MHAARYLCRSSLRLAPILIKPFSTSTTPRAAAGVPWFVDHEERPSFSLNEPPHIARNPSAFPAVPEDAPEPLKALHAQLATSPHLDPSTLVVSRPVTPSVGPPLPLRVPHGKRGRGGTYAGTSELEFEGGIWSWIVMAQVKEGTENRGAIESVVRVVRKVLLSAEPPLVLPPKSRRQMAAGWAMIDAGNYAVHILSKEAREKYFNQERWSEW
ncbi:hypothetical protein BDQ17DRAFT_1239785 [Cyathus striatus]|nr:hypothetical protein BDQ17DRAFT_1239785 [Cyathus striatus]